jgi:hypothetical protein
MNITLRETDPRPVRSPRGRWAGQEMLDAATGEPVGVAPDGAEGACQHTDA